MQAFELDERLQADCYRLSETERFSYLLHKNAEVTWIILVPHILHRELYQLEPAVQARLYDQINHISEFIHSNFSVDKINVASIGNVVSQLHIHVIGRRKDDAYWPDVVWGKALESTYEAEQLEAMRAKFIAFFKL